MKNSDNIIRKTVRDILEERFLIKEELSTFLQKIKEKVINYSNGNLEWYFLKKVDGWPVIKYGEGGASPKEAREKGLKMEEQKADMENFEVLTLTPDKLVVSSGGDWQYPYIITIGLSGGKLKVTDSKPYKKGDRDKRIKKEEIYKILQAEDILPMQEHDKAKEDAKRLVDQSFNKPYWEDIKKLWFKFDKGGYEGPEHDRYLKPLVQTILNDEDLYYSSNKKMVEKYIEKEIRDRLTSVKK